MIIASRLSYSYAETQVVHGVDLRVDEGRVLGLIGPNGSGKTTLLRMLYGALQPSDGSVELDGRALSAYRADELARRLAVVVQEPTGDLPITVSDMVLLGRAPHRSMFGRYRDEDHAIAADSLRRVGARHLAARQFLALSGGEKQRVLMARALTQQAEHLLLDEPTNHLDIRYQHELLRLVRRLGVTTVVVLHDLNLAARYCDDVVLLHGGHAIASGSTSEVLTPEILEPVYDIGIHRVELGDGPYLLFHPRESADPAALDAGLGGDRVIAGASRSLYAVP